MLRIARTLLSLWLLLVVLLLLLSSSCRSSLNNTGRFMLLSSSSLLLVLLLLLSLLFLLLAVVLLLLWLLVVAVVAILCCKWMIAAPHGLLVVETRRGQSTAASAISLTTGVWQTLTIPFVPTLRTPCNQMNPPCTIMLYTPTTIQTGQSACRQSAPLNRRWIAYMYIQYIW